jgi:hypothetical protein
MVGQTGQYEAELRRRLKTATNETEMAKVREWFLELLAVGPLGKLRLHDLSPFLQWFTVHEIYEPYQRWVAAQKKNKNP